MNTLKIKQIIKLSLIGIIIPLMFGCSNHLSRDEAEKAIIAKENLPVTETRPINFMESIDFSSTIPYTEEFWRKFSNTIQLDETEIKSIADSPKKIILFENMEKAGLINYSLKIYNVWINGAPNFHYGGPTGFTMIKDNFPVRGSVIHNANITEEGKKYLMGDNNMEEVDLSKATPETLRKKYLIRENVVEVATIEFSDITGIVEMKEFSTAEVHYVLKRKNITPFGKIFNLHEETINRSVTFTKYDDGWRISQ